MEEFTDSYGVIGISGVIMETAIYTVHLETQTPGTIPMFQIRERLQSAGFRDAEQVFSSGTCFIFKNSTCVLVAQLKIDNNAQDVCSLKLSLDLRRLPDDSIPLAAKILADIVCNLACTGRNAGMAISADGMTPGSFDVDCQQPCDLHLRLETAISRQKQSPQQGAMRRPFGLCAGTFTVPDDFDAPLPDDIVTTFEAV
jgi:hypothetical protein